MKDHNLIFEAFFFTGFFAGLANARAARSSAERFLFTYKESAYQSRLTLPTNWTGRHLQVILG